MKVAFYTLGCRMNQFDTHFIANRFLSEGYEIVDFDEEADVYVINTCTVTTGGDRASRQAIYRAKRKNPKALVVATGCYAQVSPQDLLGLEEVDLVVGNTHKSDILKLVEEVIEGREKRSFVGEIFRENDLRTFDTVTYFEEARPFLKIQEGCNKFCTFCVIPYARGKVRSAPKEKVIDQVKALVDMGYEEVVLSGTQLSQYGWDQKTSLYELLSSLVNVEGLKLIRLSSMHIKELDRRTLDFLCSEDKIAPHFHLSLQSASDKVLRDMERGYTLREYRSVVEHILRSRPENAIGTDVIVGFPSEGEEEFAETLSFIKDFPFAYLHVFPYSDRPNTKAYSMRPKVPERVKKERVAVLKDLDEIKREEFYRKNVGRKLRATVISDGRAVTENYIHINIDTGDRPGRVITLTLEDQDRAQP